MISIAVPVLTLMGAMLQVEAAQPPDEFQGLPAGVWKCWLESDLGDIPFELILERAEGDESWRGSFVGGLRKSVEIPRVTIDGETNNAKFEFPHFASQIVAEISDDGLNMAGVWQKQAQGNQAESLAFKAQWASERLGDPDTPLAEMARLRQGLVQMRFTSEPINSESQQKLPPYWAVDIGSSGEPAIGAFRQVAGSDVVIASIGSATLSTPDLAGLFQGDVLKLSGFDGCTAALIKARIVAGNRLVGYYCADGSKKQELTGLLEVPFDFRDLVPEVAFNDTLKLDDGFPVIQFDSEPVAIDEEQLEAWPEEFGGKVTLICIVGSWNAASYEHARFIDSLYRKYGAGGLKVDGLGFEHAESRAEGLQQLKLFESHTGLSYPLFLAGSSDEDSIARALPFLSEPVLFPTTLMIDHRGRVRESFSGDLGSAAGVWSDYFPVLYESRVRELLREKGKSDSVR